MPSRAECILLVSGDDAMHNTLKAQRMLCALGLKTRSKNSLCRFKPQGARAPGSRCNLHHWHSTLLHGSYVRVRNVLLCVANRMNCTLLILCMAAQQGSKTSCCACQVSTECVPNISVMPPTFVPHSTSGAAYVKVPRPSDLTSESSPDLLRTLARPTCAQTTRRHWNK
jgi:hypothetical protein